MEKNGHYYLRDTSGREYRLATEIDQLNDSILALDLSKKKLRKIPPSVFKHPKLKILFLAENQLTALPLDIIQLPNLIFLDLSRNYLAQVSFGLAKHISKRIRGLEHAWNAVKIKDKWWLLDAT